MTLKPINIDISTCPDELRPLLSGANVYDSSCSQDARVVFIEKDGGYFLKSAPKKNALAQEATMTRYFHNKGFAANVLAYVSDERDWLLTEKIHGDDCIAAKYLEQPERLCTLLGERLALLHATDFSDCPVQNHTERYLSKAAGNKCAGTHDTSYFPDYWGGISVEESWAIVESQGHLLRTDTLLHGDYCLPNIILNDWYFAGFIDLDHGGVGDRHVDLFWGMWSINWNLNKNKQIERSYIERFFDAYGRDKIDEEILRVVAAVEVFG